MARRRKKNAKPFAAFCLESHRKRDGERTNEQERTRAPNQHGEAAAAGLEQINPVHPSELLLCTSASKQEKKIKCKKD
jgi:hypothetical protein